MTESRFFDTHCHLADEQFQDPGAIVDNARLSGVTGIAVIGLDVANSIASAEMAERYDLHFAAGVHPCSLEQPEGSMQTLRRLLTHPRCVAVGEIGLDFYWEEIPVPVQFARLQAMLSLAVEFQLPVILHQRHSFDQLWSELNCIELPRAGIFHCWSGTIAQAEQVLADGYYISFAGNVTYKKNDDLRNVAGMVPLDRLLIETDAPYMAPNKQRGKRNEPAYITQTASMIANIRGLTVNEVASLTYANANNIFKLPML